MSGIGTFGLGVAAALIAQGLGPAIARRGRPLVRGAFKQAIILGRGTQVRVEGMREDLQDLVAEARAEVRQGRTGQPAQPGQRVQSAPAGQAQQTTPPAA